MTENANERFERRAAQFFKETGFMAPGKDQPAALGGPSYEQRVDAWLMWDRKQPK